MTSVVYVTFGKFSDKTYAYKCKYEVAAGDHVVVDSPHDGYTCVKVKEVNKNSEDSKATKSVVCVVDDSDYLNTIKTEEEKKKIMSELKNLSDEVNKLNFYKVLAADNPKIKDLLTKLESLGE